MLLNPKKSQREEQNWCVILSPLRNEIDKKKVAQKIASVFSLSSEEAADLVSNTPIILLDNLTHSIAAKLKDYFQSSGAQTVLTNDVFQKRKCYRTVWPEQPNLSFLHDWSPLAESGEEHEALETDEALNEIWSMMKEDVKKNEPLQPVLTGTSQIEYEQLLEEMERWRRECMALREEQRRIREEHDSIKKPVDTEAEGVRLLLAASEEKYQILKDEYREARRLYEEKISTLVQEGEQGKKRTEEMVRSLESLKQEKHSRDQEFSQKEDQSRRGSEEYERTNRLLQERISVSAQESERWKSQVQELSGKLELHQKIKEDLERTLNEQAEQMVSWSQKYNTLTQHLDFLEKEQKEEREARKKVEARQQDLEKDQLRLIQEVESKASEIHQWESRCQDMDRQLAELRRLHENQEKVIQNSFKQLEARDLEVETARRQLREIESRAQEQEVARRKLQLVTRVEEQEKRLKQLVEEQQRIEAEISGREDVMRKILAEQETVEKDILEAKQTQWLLAENKKRPEAGIKNISEPGFSDAAAKAHD